LSVDHGGVRDLQFEVAQGESTWTLPADDGQEAALAPAVLPALSFGGRWQASGTVSSDLLIDDFVFAGQPRGRLSGRTVDGRTHLHGEVVALAPLATLATVTRATPARVRRWLHAAQPVGTVAAMDIAIDGRELRQRPAERRLAR